ncbi:MAG: hypothetical protein ABMB14_24660 [Myxococcota bacterium]
MPTLLDGLDAGKLSRLQEAYASQLRAAEPGSARQWSAVTSLLKAQYCALMDLSEVRRKCIEVGLSTLDTGAAPGWVVLMELWPLAWQERELDLIAEVARYTRNEPSALDQDVQYLRFVDTRVVPTPAPSPPDDGPDIVQALVLPVPEARALIAEVVNDWRKRAERQRTTGRKVALLGPVAWIRGVAWARHAMTGEDVTPPELGRFFYDWPYRQY